MNHTILFSFSEAEEKELQEILKKTGLSFTDIFRAGIAQTIYSLRQKKLIMEICQGK